MLPILFQFGPLTIYSFGVFMALAALAAAWVVQAELKRKGYNPELASTMVFAAAIGGLVGARILFIIEDWSNFLAPRGTSFLPAPASHGTAVSWGRAGSYLGCPEKQYPVAEGRRHRGAGPRRRLWDRTFGLPHSGGRRLGHCDECALGCSLYERNHRVGRSLDWHSLSPGRAGPPNSDL